MADEQPFGVNLNKERLLALIVLVDEHAARLSSKAGEAYFRAFVVEDRASHEIWCRFRFRYTDGDSWFTIGPRHGDRVALVREFYEGLRYVVVSGAALMGDPCLTDADVKCFEPPDDEGHYERTVAWLLAHDVIHPPRLVSKGKGDA